MSKHNYSQYSNKKPTEKYIAERDTEKVESVEIVEEVTVPETAEAAPAVIENTQPEIKLTEGVVEAITTPEKAPAPKTVIGFIVDCKKLNIRVAPNSNATVAHILEVNTEVEIDVKKSTSEWFKICTASGVEGYCMRKFVNARV